MRQNVTFEEIVIAAESIFASGANPTIEKVRISLGSRGSNSTISKYLNIWREKRNHENGPITNGIASLAHEKSINDDYIIENPNAEITILWEQLSALKIKYKKTLQEGMLAKNNFDNLQQYHFAWKKEKDKYIADLQQAHAISLEVLRENYSAELKDMKQQLNSLLNKMDKYINEHYLEREKLIIKLQKMENLLTNAQKGRRLLKQKILTLAAKNKKLESSFITKHHEQLSRARNRNFTNAQ